MSQAQILVDSSATIASLADANVIPVLVSATTGTGTAIAVQIPLSQLATFFETSDAPITIDSNSASAFAVGPNGATNPVFVVDASTASQAAGLKLTGATAAGNVAVAVISSGAAANLTIDAKGSGTVTIGATSTGNVVLGDSFTVTSAGAVTGATTIAASTSVTVTSASAVALAVGLAGATNPAFVVDSSTGSQAAGLKVTGAATGGTVALVAIDSGSNTSVTANAKGTGTIGIGTASTGQTNLTRGSLVPPIVGTTLTSIGTAQSSTPTAAQLLGGIVTQTGETGPGTFTLPTGTLLSGAVTGVAVGDSFDCIFANLGGGQTITITGDTGSTVLGTAAVPSGRFATMKFINTGANTWNVYVVLSA